VGYRVYEQSDDRRSLVIKLGISVPLVLIALAIIHIHSPYTPLFVLFPAVTLGLMWAPNIGALLAGPLTGTFDGGGEEVEPKPYYFLAEGKRRKGLYEEAVGEVRKQLEMFPGDYEGYLKLASIQMEDLKNLPAAEATLNEFLEFPDCPPNEVAGVLHLLADWQLQFGRDAAAATASLQRIVALYPATPLAHAAEQRIAHLGSADETSRARHEAKFVVKQGERDLGLKQSGAPPAPVEDPDALASQYVKQLQLHPSDTEAREKLAVLYAEHFQRLDLAADQLEQLIALPSEPPKHVARWLNLLATMHIRQAKDLKAAEAALHRIIQKFPGGALATVATARLANLQSEVKVLGATAAKTLGTYEKDIGLHHTP
jgi:tetratricopeptide (TPR) repeat protein